MSKHLNIVARRERGSVPVFLGLVGHHRRFSGRLVDGDPTLNSGFEETYNFVILRRSSGPPVLPLGVRMFAYIIKYLERLMRHDLDITLQYR